MATSNLVLRTVYLSPALDDKLRDEAYLTHTSKNDLIRRYIEAGMNASPQQARSAASPPAKASAARKTVAAKRYAVPKEAPATKAAPAKNTAPARKTTPARKASTATA